MFEHFPVENMAYVRLIMMLLLKSSGIADSGHFINFMLDEILSALNIAYCLLI